MSVPQSEHHFSAWKRKTAWSSNLPVCLVAAILERPLFMVALWCSAQLINMLLVSKPLCKDKTQSCVIYDFGDLRSVGTWDFIACCEYCAYGSDFSYATPIPKPATHMQGCKTKCTQTHKTAETLSSTYTVKPPYSLIPGLWLPDLTLTIPDGSSWS